MGHDVSLGCGFGDVDETACHTCEGGCYHGLPVCVTLTGVHIGCESILCDLHRDQRDGVVGTEQRSACSSGFSDGDTVLCVMWEATEVHVCLIRIHDQTVLPRVHGESPRDRPYSITHEVGDDRVVDIVGCEVCGGDTVLLEGSVSCVDEESDGRGPVVCLVSVGSGLGER